MGPRLGITVTRKVGGAVVRHKIKRRIREIYRRWSQRRQLPAYDLLLHAKPRAREADFTALETEIQRLLQQLITGERQAG
jgi:ribonuclease P protein component